MTTRTQTKETLNKSTRIQSLLRDIAQYGDDAQRLYYSYHEAVERQAPAGNLAKSALEDLNDIQTKVKELLDLI